MIRRALEESAGNQAAAARALGIPRSTLRDRMRLLGAEPALDEVS
jgi:DNA-binding NtrC family response regulator